MKKIVFFVIAAKIEYHWWIIKMLTKRETEAAVAKKQLHRESAERLSIIYEIYAGLRDY